MTNIFTTGTKKLLKLTAKFGHWKYEKLNYRIILINIASLTEAINVLTSH